MNRETIVKFHLDDLKVGYELAEITKNSFLQDYIKNQFDVVKSNYNFDFFTDFDLVFAYAVDLVLFIKTSKIINDNENKDYFYSRLKELCDEYPKLLEKNEVREVL